jgi:DOPA 4,5-dioxygenase
MEPAVAAVCGELSMSDALALADPNKIVAYHAHIYYDVASTKDTAAWLRDQITKLFPDGKIGRWHDEMVGPHPISNFQIAFPTETLAALVPWLMLNRNGLTVLLHPETGDDYTDHATNAVWFGEKLPLRLEMLRQ